MDARSVSASLGIPYYLIDESAEFQKRVIGYFAEEYRAGRTPNPCVMCNQHLKFGTLLDRARQLGCDLVATGHFARVERTAEGRSLLLRGRDPRKDQSYFLFSLRQHQLARVLFPLGEKTKSDTREVARDIAATIEHVKTIPATPFPSDVTREVPEAQQQEAQGQEEASAEEVKPAKTELKRPRRS
jgi:tRNA-specific 2-thiouridylase